MLAEVLIVGGGPSGLSTALHLAQLAPDLIPHILILEKAHYPRRKLCGGGLTGDAEVILERLGLDVTEVPHVDAVAARFDFQGKGLRYVASCGHTLRMIRRDEFDAWLAGKAEARGIKIRAGVNVRSVRPGQDAVRVETDAGLFHARVVVGADGSNGITRRSILPNSPIHTARALEVLVPALPQPSSDPMPIPRSRDRGCAAAPLPAATARPGDTNLRAGRGLGKHQANVAYFDFAPVPLGIAGYTWDFPTQVNGQPMRCWGIYDTNLLAQGARPQLKHPLAAEMGLHGTDLESAEIQGHPIRWFSPRSGLSVPRVILVGDAAGADGIFGEGISIALGYGAVAARAIHAAFVSGDYSFKDYRQRILSSPLGQALTVRTAITHLLYHLHWAWFQRLFWHVLKSVVAAVSSVIVLNWARRMR